MGSRVAAVALLAAVTGCSYDWSIAQESSPDAGDSGADATTQDSSLPDATPPADADVDAGPGADASVDSGPPSCSALLSTITTAEGSAKVGCTGGVACTSTVTDQCGCTFFVASPSSAATDDLVTAVAAFDAGHCTPACGTCPAPTTSVQCLDMAASDGGFEGVCEEP